MRRFLLWFFLIFIVLLGIGFFAISYLAQSHSRLDAETVSKLKAPITPDQEKRLLELTRPLLGPPPQSPKPRVVILGMDGLDFQYLNPLIQEGKLPNFKRMMEEGTSATLLSILPPNSGGAWPALVTGCNAGKTDLLNFRRYDLASRQMGL
ncbi:alkaline phosphatase family protein [candidate division TA06 bacterium]|nr:alkaline phosphatase family protein [candidate division TA06 bacterium]